MVIFKVFCYSVVNGTGGISMYSVVLFWSIFFFSWPYACHLSMATLLFVIIFCLDAIFWLQGVPHMLLPCTELTMQTNDMSSVTTCSLISCWLIKGSSGRSCQLRCIWAILLIPAELPKCVRNEGLATERRTVISAQTGHVKPVATSQCDGINEGKE